MACPDEHLVDTFVRGRADEAARQAMSVHLASCPACRMLVSALAKEGQATRTLIDAPEHAATIAESTAAFAAPRARSFSEGERVADRYRIVSFIAEGGMGEVYRAEDLELSRHVALKTVRAEIAADPRALDRFRREIALAHKVTHPNVCRIFDLGVHHRGERITFLTMEFLDGETLSQHLRRRGPLSVDEARPLIEQMSAGLAAAHAAGVVHRDFKSPNVLLVPNASGLRAVISDFGLAAPTLGAETDESSSVARGLVGSPAYMAPEQVEGRKADARADIYALGIVLYEMMTGVWPFVADTPMRTAMLRLQQAPPSPLSLRPSLPSSWATTILRCLARDPADRFADAREVAAALTVVTASRPRRTRAAWLGAALALCAMGAGLGWARLHRPTSTASAASRSSPPHDAAPLTPTPAVEPATHAPVITPRVRRRGKTPSVTASDARWQGEIVDTPGAQ
jgi:serine/threonine protein kinase